MAINSYAQQAALYKKGLDCIYHGKDYEEDMWKHLFKERKATMQTETAIEMYGLGLAVPAQSPGAPMTYKQMGQAFSYTTSHCIVKLGFSISREAKDDNQYPADFPNATKQLGISMRQTKEYIGHSVFNNAFNPMALMGDGQPLLSTQHPLIVGGVYSNTLPVQTDLTEASLEQMIITIRKFVKQDGLPCDVRPKKLVVPVELEFSAMRLLNSQFAPGNNTNAINPLFGKQGFPDGYIADRYLLNPRSWFILTSADGLIHYNRIPIEFDSDYNKQTQSYENYAYERYSFNCIDPRSVAGCAPSS